MAGLTLGTRRRGEDGEPSPIGWTWLLAAGFIGAVVAALVVTGIVLYTGRDQPQGGGPPVAPPTQSTGNNEPSAGASKRPSTSPTSPGAPAPDCSEVEDAKGPALTSAPETKWQLVDTLAVPKTQGGPGRQEGYIAECYTPDTTGALTAAVQIYLRSQIQPGGDIVRAKQWTPASIVHTDEARRDWEAANPQKPWLQLEAFSVGKIEDNQTVARLKITQGEGYNYLVVEVPMKWVGTDWQIHAVRATTPTTDDAGMIPWSGM